MKIYYGIENQTIDVTDICFSKLMKNHIITIPSGDCNRAHFFTDPLPGILKKIFIDNDGFTEYDTFTTVKINLLTNEIHTTNESDGMNKLISIQTNLQLNYGNFQEELPEQKMVVRYLTGNEKVLEIGGNIGRNSCIISSIVGTNLVTLESDINITNQLRENKELNQLSFHIENSALSNRKLIQTGWNTFPSDTLLEGYNWVNTITYSELVTKYNIDFDTLVLDCEGAFYYILMDMPEILNNIQLIIMENDYTDLSHKIFIDDTLTKNNFTRDYVEGGGWGPCKNFFFEVWKKRV
jgi:FkbM family methyltransferase